MRAAIRKDAARSRIGSGAVANAGNDRATARSLGRAGASVADLDASAAEEMDAFIAEMEQRTPLGRIGVPDYVARVALLCASDLAMLMTESTLMVDAVEGVL